MNNGLLQLAGLAVAPAPVLLIVSEATDLFPHHALRWGAIDLALAAVLVLGLVAIMLLSASGTNRLRNFLQRQDNPFWDVAVLLLFTGAAAFANLKLARFGSHVTAEVQSLRASGAVPDLFATDLLEFLTPAWAVLCGFKLRVFWDVLVVKLEPFENGLLGEPPGTTTKISTNAEEAQ